MCTIPFYGISRNRPATPASENILSDAKEKRCFPSLFSCCDVDSCDLSPGRASTMSSSLGGGRAAGRRGRPAGRGVGPAVREQWLKPPPARLSSAGGPGHLRRRALHRGEGGGAEPRGGEEAVGGGPHRLPRQGRLRPHPGEAGPLPAVSRAAPRGPPPPAPTRADAVPPRASIYGYLWLAHPSASPMSRGP